MRKSLFYAVSGRIEMNDRIFGKQIAIGIEFKVVAGFVKHHLFGVFQVLPHCQLRRVRIFTDQRFQGLIVIVTSVIRTTENVGPASVVPPGKAR